MTSNPPVLGFAMIEVNGIIYRSTQAGLPNTCAGSGVEIVGEGYAVNDDQARAGQVFCIDYLQSLIPAPEPTKPPKPAKAK